MLQLRMRENRVLSGRGRLWLGRAVAAVFGNRNPGIRMAAVLLVVLGVALGMVRTELRITADAELRGDKQRVAVAPFDGFIARAPVRAGDVVQAGDVLAVLDDTDLRLDLLRWESELARLEQEKSTALAAGDRAEIAAADTEIARVTADADLARSRLGRVTIRAPFDGLVISGDLSQRLGAPVQQGDDLFQVAASEDLRLDLRIGEYDIGLVERGAPGRLALSGIGGGDIAFEVTRIAEVATAGDGEIEFRAEARLIDPPPGLRPGLEGVAKVDAGQARLFHALFRPVTERLHILLCDHRRDGRQGKPGRHLAGGAGSPGAAGPVAGRGAEPHDPDVSGRSGAGRYRAAGRGTGGTDGPQAGAQAGAVLS
jgi:multidrug efflux pump subunit AcrA (membrane-fusion protein)